MMQESNRISLEIYSNSMIRVKKVTVEKWNFQDNLGAFFILNEVWIWR